MPLGINEQFPAYFIQRIQYMHTAILLLKVPLTVQFLLNVLYAFLSFGLIKYDHLCSYSNSTNTKKAML